MTRCDSSTSMLGGAICSMARRCIAASPSATVGLTVATKRNDWLADAHRSEQPRQQPRLVAGDRSGLIDAGGAVDAAEQPGRIVRGFRGPEEDIAARIERVVKRAAHLLLQFAIEIDQEITAGDQVDVGKWRVFEQIVDGEQDYIAELLADAVMIALAREETAQPLLVDVGFDGKRISSLARRSERPRIEIGAEYLDRRRYACAPPLPSAAWRRCRPPHRWRSRRPKRGLFRRRLLARLNSAGNNVLASFSNASAIAEECRHRDETGRRAAPAPLPRCRAAPGNSL